MAATLLLALRRATTRAAAESAADAAVDRLISTQSLPEAQQLWAGVERCVRDNQQLFEDAGGFLVDRLKQPASVCAEPADKAAFLGHELLANALSLRNVDDTALAKTLQGVYAANPSALVGFVSALDALDEVGTESKRAVLVAAPMVLMALTSAKESAGTKAALVEVLGRLAWSDNDAAGNFPTRLTASRLLLKALHFHLPNTAPDAAVYTVITSTVVDLVTSMIEPPVAGVRDTLRNLSASICDAILAIVEHLHVQQLPVSQLFQGFQRLVAVFPEVSWRSEICVWSAYFLSSDAIGPQQKRQIMNGLRHALAYGKNLCSKASMVTRSVYIEALVLPLSAMLATDRKHAGQLLQYVTDIMRSSTFVPNLTESTRPAKGSRDIGGNVGDIATHAAMFLALIGGELRCEAWLDSLSFEITESKTAPLNERWMLLLLSSLLFDSRASLRNGAARALDRQTADKHNKYWSQDSSKLLVSALVFLLSQKHAIAGKNEWLATSLYVLGALSTSSNDTMKIVLRVIDSMKSTAALRGTALRLLFAVWVREPRVFPRLEAFLMDESNEDSAEYRIAKIATLKALCEKDPEAGVDFVGQVQSSLEDPLVSIAGMAIDAIGALCRSDCLDFYTAFKIIALKVRKKKVGCADHPLFLEKLCGFYALGVSDMEANEKQASKLLAQLWELAETSEDAPVRCAAFKSLNAYPLEAAGLIVATEDDTHVSEDEENEDDSEEEEEDEAIVNTTSLLNLLATENDESTRDQIKLLVTRVLEHESRRHTAGIGRGQMKSYSVMDPSQQHPTVSAAATKELTKCLPSPSNTTTLLYPSNDSEPTSLQSLVGFLLAFRPTAEDGSTLEAQRKSGKRKDRLVRYALQETESCEKAMNAVLHRMQDETPWASEEDNSSETHTLLSLLALIEGWQGFMGTYVSCLEEYAHLKVPTTAEEGTACAFFVEIVNTQMDQLTRGSGNGRFMEVVAAGALLGQLCGLRRYWREQPVRSYFIKALSSQSQTLLQAFESWNVFRDKKQQSLLIASMLSVQLALLNVRPLTKREMNAEWLRDVISLQATPLTKTLDLLSAGNAEPTALQTCASMLLSLIGCTNLSTGNIEQTKLIAHQLLATALQSLGIEVPSTALQSVFVGGKQGADQITRAIEAVDNACDDRRLIVAWSAFLSLGQLSSHFGSSQQLNWLEVIESILLALWRRGETMPSMRIACIALGPVLLENIRFGLTSSTAIDEFLSSCEARVNTATSLSRIDIGTASVFVIVPYMLSRVPRFVGYDVIHERLETFLENASSVLAESGNTVAQDFVVTGLTNFFDYSLGVKLIKSCDPSLRCEYQAGDSRKTKEMSFETVAINRIMQLVQDGANKSRFARLALGATARQADAFHVVQKKLSLEVEMRALPATGLLARTLELLVKASMPSTSSNTTDVSEQDFRQQINALLFCLATTGPTLPQFDFAPVITRLIARMQNTETSSLCIRFASTQGSCDALFVRELVMSSAFAVSYLPVQAEILSGLARVAVRIPASLTVDAIEWTTDSVFLLWANNTTKNTDYQQVVEAWISLLSALVSPITSPASSKASETLEAVRTAVSEKILTDYLSRLPFRFQDEHLIQVFATTVLAQLNVRERLADLLLSPSLSGTTDNGGSQNKWTWWRDGVLFSELAMATSIGEVATLARRELALLVQWLIRHDFSEWNESTRFSLNRLMASFTQLIAASTKSLDESVVSSLLDVVDGYARSQAEPSDKQLKCTVLFELTAGVCSLSWRDCLPFEQYLLTSSVDATEAISLELSPALLLMPTALARRVTSNRRWLPLYEQLWNVFGKWISPSLPRKVLNEHALAVENCFLRVSGTSLVNLSLPLKAGVDQWWSCSNLEL